MSTKKLSKEEFVQILQKIDSATSSEQNKYYSDIMIKPCISGYRESRSQFLIDIDILYDIYTNEEPEDITPSFLETYIKDKTRSAAAAILKRIYELTSK